MKKPADGLKLLPLVAAAMLLLAACASMGRPDGGPRDFDPPVFVKASPAPGAVNVDGNKVTILFNENVQLDDPMNKIVISPAQKSAPSISANGHRVTVELRDTLMPNTTYTIDFTDAIKDLNEGNVLDGFAVDFSTGDTVDSLCISGMVFEAATLEPAQGMLVGAYLNRGDTAIATTAFDRITKTNQRGQFTLRNLREGTYRVYALNDNNRDYHWDRSEDIAFLDSAVTPRAVTVAVSDTVWRENGDIDTIIAGTTTSYRPNNLILTWFNENYQPQYLKEYSRPDSRRLSFTFGAPGDTFPTLRPVNGPRAGEPDALWSVLQANATRDSLTYWITDPAVVAFDSLMVEARYQRLDSLERLEWYTDTLKFFIRQPSKKESDKKKKKTDDEAAVDADSVPQVKPLAIKLSIGSMMELNQPLVLTSPTPVDTFDTGAVTLEVMVDSTWTPVERPRFVRLSEFEPLTYTAPYSWQQDTRYRLTVDSAAVADVYGLRSARLENEFKTKADADYSALFFNVSGPAPGEAAVVELVNSADKPVASAPVVNSVASLEYLAPGTYYARLFIDRNANGKWDTGNLADSLQPEEVYYYPRQLTLKKNWDVEQTWDIYATALDLQKPDLIKKNKPKPSPAEQAAKNAAQGTNPDGDEEEEPGFDAYGNPNYNPFDPNSSRNARDNYNGYNR